MPASLMASMPGDSVGVKVVNGKSFVLYKLAKGDNLGKLSREYGVSVASLEELNSTTAATIQAGQILMVPSRTAAAGMSLKTVVDPKPTVVQSTPTEIKPVTAQNSGAQQNPSGGERKQHTIRCFAQIQCVR